MDKKIVFSNLMWRFMERIGAQLVTFIVSIILARILDPTVYGTVAIMTVFIVLLQVLVDSGLGNALIQKKDVDNIDFSTVFFANLIFCICLYILLFIMSPYIATFYGNIHITSYLRVLGLTVLISGIKNVQQAYVSKHLMFKRFFFSTIIGTIIAGVLGVLMAYAGYGVWAIVIQQVINLAIDTIILWITVEWRPVFVFSFKRLKVLFSYGWKLLISAMLDSLYNNIYQLLIGKVYTKSELAFYNQGDKFPKLIITNINSSIDSVLLPVMSKEQDSNEHIKNMTRRSIKISVYIMAPLMIGLASCGYSVIGLLLTEKWLPSLFFLQVFCISYIFWPIHTANLNAIKALGRSDLFLKLEIFKKTVGVLGLILSVFISVKAMAISIFITSFVNQIINALPNKKLFNYGFNEQMMDIIPTIALATIMGVLIYPIQYLDLSYLCTLLIQVPLGVFIYIIGSKIMRLDSFEYLLGIFKPYLKILKR